MVRRKPRRRRNAPLRMVGAPQEARMPELLLVAGCAWGTYYLSILLVDPCKDLFKLYLNVLVNVPREVFIFPLMSFRSTSEDPLLALHHRRFGM